jgi:hypothetical protein
MRKGLIRTLGVLAATTIAALLVYGIVSMAIAVSPQSGGTTAAAATAGGTAQVCPRTGCASADCHGATGAPPPSGGGNAGAALGQSGTAGGSGSVAQTCPRTGCASANCHGATGQAPPGGGGYGRQSRHDDYDSDSEYGDEYGQEQSSPAY